MILTHSIHVYVTIIMEFSGKFQNATKGNDRKRQTEKKKHLNANQISSWNETKHPQVISSLQIYSDAAHKWISMRIKIRYGCYFIIKHLYTYIPYIFVVLIKLSSFVRKIYFTKLHKFPWWVSFVFFLLYFISSLSLCDVETKGRMCMWSGVDAIFVWHYTNDSHKFEHSTAQQW